MRSRLGRIGADFHTHLSAKTITLDYAQEKALCTAVLDRLEKDSSNDVQALAVKCLSVLVHVAADVQVITISDRLCQHILSGRAEMRDVYGIGMKTLIAEAQLAQKLLDRGALLRREWIERPHRRRSAYVSTVPGMYPSSATVST